MGPFPASKLGPTETNFNKRVFQALQFVECAFGINSKCRLLQKATELNPGCADKIVKCICFLHYIITDKEVGEQAASFTFQHTQSKNRIFGTLDENRDTTSTYVIRDKFKTHFCSRELRNGKKIFCTIRYLNK